MRRMAPFLVAFSALALPATPSEAADHYDMFEGNPIGGQEPKQHDIVDLFAFPSPDGSGKLVMIMNTNNRAHPSTAFSDAIHYTFRLRAGEQRGQGNEYRITCTFSPIPEDGTNADQKATCIAYKVVAGVATPIQGASTKVGFEQDGGGKNPALKAFVGRRADAFFGDAPNLLVAIKTHSLLPVIAGAKLPAFPGRNLTQNTNDLSIVLEVDTQTLLGEPGSVFRVACETAIKKSEGGAR